MRLSAMSNIHQQYRHTKNDYAFGVDEAIIRTSKAGFKAIDISMISVSLHGNELSRPTWRNTVELWGNTLAKENMTACQSHAYFPQAQARMNDDEQFALTCRSLESSAMLNIPWVTVHPLSCKAENCTRAQTIRKNREYFLRLADTAKKLGVGIAIENMVAEPFNHPEPILELLDELHDDSLFGVCLDTGHAYLSSVPLPAIIGSFGSRLKATHIHDNHGKYDEHLLPYFGDIEWDQVMQALKNIRYTGAFSFEIPRTTRNIPDKLRDPLMAYAVEIGNYLLSL